MENITKPKRMLSQDIGKALCILAIMLSHILKLPLLASRILFSIFGFSLSFFFVISGYNYHGRKCSYWQMIYKRFKQLFIPFFVILIFTIIIFGTIGILAYNASFKDVLINSLESFIGNNDMAEINPNIHAEVCSFKIPSWFIWNMFGGYLIFYGLVDWTLAKTYRPFIVVPALFTFTFVFSLLENLGVGFVVAFSSVSIGRAFITSPLVTILLLCGVYFGKKKVFETGKEKRLIVIITSLVAFAITTTFGFFFTMSAGFVGGHINGTMPFSLNFGIWEVPLTLVLSVLFSYHFTQFSRLLEKGSKYLGWLIFIGQHSLELYLLHCPISFLLRRLFGLFKDGDAIWPAESLNDSFNYKSILVYLLTILVCVLGVYLYYFAKKKIHSKKDLVA